MRLSAEELSCSRGGRPVFSGLSFTLEAGRALVVEGPNGAGKSTLLRLIAGLLTPDSGRIDLDGGDEELSVGQQCHYAGHLDGLKPALSVRQNLDFWAAFFGRADGPAEQDATDDIDALSRFRLEHLRDLPAGYLSAGQKRRLALARLLVAARPVWLLDEPTVSLDADAKRDLEGACERHLAGGGLIVAATHLPIDLGEVSTLRLEGRAS